MSVKLVQAASAIAALLRAPTNFPAAIRLSDAFADWGPFRWAYRHMLDGLSPSQIEHLRELTLRPLDLPALLRLPESSFGHHYARFIEHNRLDPDAYTAAFPPYDDTLGAHWALRRFAKVHDIHHFLLGFPIDFQGEMGLQAFNLRNFREPHALISLPMLPLVVAKLGQTKRTAREVQRGWALASQIPNLFKMPFEEMFALPLDEVLSRLHIAERPPTPWANAA